MISLAQIKAARALIDWTQETLAKASGLSLPGINNLERGLTSPRRETLAAIEKALGDAGIEFIDTSGVRLKTPDLGVEMIEGPNWLEVYDRDIIAHMHGPGDEILQYSCDERQWMIYGGTTNHYYVDHRAKTGFQERILVPETIDYITGLPSSYRTLPPDYFARTSYQVYAGRVAQILWESRKIVLLKSTSLADSFRAQFELAWKQGKPLNPATLKKLERWEGSAGSKKKLSSRKT